jgi:hypothetical protein
MQLNPSVIPTLANCFSRAQDFIGNGIVLFDGGKAALDDPGYPSHSFPITRNQGYIMATEELEGGLTEDSLSRFCENDKNRIVACYYWRGWNELQRRVAGEAWLAEIRSKGGKPTSYNYQFIWYRMFSAIPFIANIWRKSVHYQAMTCSMESARIMRVHGCPWITTDDLSPKQLLDIMQQARKDYGPDDPIGCDCILNYYV